MSRPVSFDEKRWQALAELALAAVTRPELTAYELARRAADMTTAATPKEPHVARCAFNAFRWTCQAYGGGDAVERGRMAPAVQALAREILAILDPASPPPPVGAAALPLPDEAPGEAAWQRRADLR